MSQCACLHYFFDYLDRPLRPSLFFCKGKASAQILETVSSLEQNQQMGNRCLVAYHRRIISNKLEMLEHCKIALMNSSKEAPLATMQPLTSVCTFRCRLCPMATWCLPFLPYASMIRPPLEKAPKFLKQSSLPACAQYSLLSHARNCSVLSTSKPADSCSTRDRRHFRPSLQPRRQTW